MRIGQLFWCCPLLLFLFPKEYVNPPVNMVVYTIKAAISAHIPRVLEELITGHAITIRAKGKLLSVHQTVIVQPTEKVARVPPRRTMHGCS